MKVAVFGTRSPAATQEALIGERLENEAPTGCLTIPLAL
jgi:hypothetical protein